MFDKNKNKKEKKNNNLNLVSYDSLIYKFIYELPMNFWGLFLWPRYANIESKNTLENILQILHTQSCHKINDNSIVRLLTIQWDRHNSVVFSPKR